MKPTTLPILDRSHAPRRCAGFTFTEILFAVMIMGVGFIMVAAMFPATMRQTMTTVEETQGAVVARAGFAAMQEIAIDYIDPSNGAIVDSTLPATATGAGAVPRMVSIKTVARAWAMASGQAILTQNPRYGWVAMYSRDYGPDGRLSDYVRVVVIAVESRDRPQYYTLSPALGEKGDVLDLHTNGHITLQPRLLKNVTVRWDSALQRALLSYGNIAMNTTNDPAAPGAFVVIAYDPTSSGSTGGIVGKSIGRIYQIGANYDAGVGSWELAPGGDMIGGPTGIADNNITNGEAYLVGRPYNDKTGGYIKTAQDIAAYTGFVRVRKVDLKYMPPIVPLP